MRLIICLTLLFSMGIAYGGENFNGRLISVDGNTVTVQLDQEANIPIGSRIVFYENIPGVGEVGVKGTWTVSSVQGSDVTGQASGNDPAPQIGCSARIQTSGSGSSGSDNNNSNIVPADTTSDQPADQWSGNINTTQPADQPIAMQQYTANLLEDPLVLKYQTMPYLGVYIGQQLNTPGAFIHAVLPNSTASEAGVMGGDIVMQFGRNRIDTAKSLFDAIDQSRIGRNYTIEVNRNNQRMPLNIQMKGNSVSRSCLKAAYDYDSGSGVAQDYTRAIDLFRKAAELGEPLADFALANKYFKGDTGLPADDKLFLEYLNKAANNNCLEAMGMLAELYDYGEVVPQNQALSREWYMKASRSGLIKATENLAYMYYHGRGGPVDKNQAKQNFLWAASFGMPSSQVALGFMYYMGEGGLQRNWNAAEEWFQRAASQGDAKGQEWLTKLQTERQQWQQQQAQQRQQQQQQQIQRQREQEKNMRIFIDTMKQFQNYRKR